MMGELISSLSETSRKKPPVFVNVNDDISKTVALVYDDIHLSLDAIFQVGMFMLNKGFHLIFSL